MIDIKIHGIERLIQELDPKIVKKAARLAVGEAAKAAKVETSKIIRKRWNIKKRDLERKFTVKKSGALESTLTIAGRPIGLSYFGAREVRVGSGGVTTRSRGRDGSLQSKRTKRTRRATGLSVEILRGQRTVLSTAWLASVHAFAGSRKGVETLFGAKSARVLQRRGRRYIVGPKSISVPSMFRQGRTAERVKARANQTLQRRFQYHLARLQGTLES